MHAHKTFAQNREGKKCKPSQSGGSELGRRKKEELDSTAGQLIKAKLSAAV